MHLVLLPMELTTDSFGEAIPIEVDSPEALMLGITSDIYVPRNCDRDHDAYPFGTQLFRKGDSMYIQLAEIWWEKRGKGHFRALLKRIELIGFTIKVPNPTSRMTTFLKSEGFCEVAEPALDGSGLDIVMVKSSVHRG